MDSLNQLNSFSKSKINTVPFYHGTKLKDIRFIADPDRHCNNPLEFGSGFYLTQNKEISIGYATFSDVSDSVVNSGAITKDNKKDFSKLVTAKVVRSGYVTTFNLKFDELMKVKTGCTVTNINLFINLLVQNLNSYVGFNFKTDDLRPRFDFTYGLLCGGIWDTYAKRSLNDQVRLQELITEIRESNYTDTQLCIHRSLIDGKNWRDYIISSSEEYVERK